ncbi:hypothetical protein SDC9_53625 [bioreactor metagenome]|uniref:DUF4412 domain-containing protein n=1 Tax=bioreactor metagenome TaxID=1076179 RepID=A0A644WU90_9ZZZZ
MFLMSIFILIGWNIAQKQKEFEGVIWYKMEFYKLDGTPFTFQMIDPGSYCKISIKKGRFIQEYPQSLLSTVIYDSKKNTEYSLFDNADSIYSNDLSSKIDIASSYSILDTTTQILGYLCKAINLKSDSINTTLFYAEDLYANPKRFSNWVTESYNIYAEKSESIYLKRVDIIDRAGTDYDLVIIMTAFSIEEKKIPNSAFRLPKLPIVKLH